MSGRDRIILQKIVKYIHEARSYTKGMDFDGFSQDSKTMSATAFVLGQIGELAKEISPELEAEYPKILWRGMRGMRNRIVHDYENVDLNMLWDVIANDLPELLTQVTSLLEGHR
jgi:uncharacterized protein with HEPN domain